MEKYTRSIQSKLWLVLILILPISVFGQFFPQEITSPEVATSSQEFFSFSIRHFDLVFFARLVLDLLSMFILVRLIYYPVAGRHDFFFTFFMFNLIIFIITILLNAESGFSIGAAFGLFAIFAMLRYRTEDISAKDMTYLFMSITIGLISSINMGSILEITAINAIILLTAFLIEGNVFLKHEFNKVIEYENIELIKPENHAELLSDLRSRTGLDIHKVFIKRIDFLRDTALIKIYYRSKVDRDV